MTSYGQNCALARSLALGSRSLSPEAVRRVIGGMWSATTEVAA